MTDKIGTTGPAYTDQEKDFLHAAAQRGLSASQLAHKFAQYAQRKPDDFHVRSISSIRVKASDMGLSLAVNLGRVTIPASGRIAFRVPDTDREAVQAGLDALTEAHEFSTLTECAVQALKDAGK